jgi:hypothetical protein
MNFKMVKGLKGKRVKASPKINLFASGKATLTSERSERLTL